MPVAKRVSVQAILVASYSSYSWQNTCTKTSLPVRHGGLFGPRRIASATGGMHSDFEHVSNILQYPISPQHVSFYQDDIGAKTQPQTAESYSATLDFRQRKCALS